MTDSSVTPSATIAPELPAPTLADAPVRRDPELRQAQIVAAAFLEFGERGLSDTRLEDIARRAGVAKGTIYLYFPNKEALFVEMIRRTVVPRMAELLADPHLPDARADFDRIVRRYWDYVNTAHFPVITRLITSESPRMPELARFFIDQVAMPWYGLLTSTIQACIDAGEMETPSAREAARMLHTMLLQHATARANPLMCAAMSIEDADHTLARILAFFDAAVRRPTSRQETR